MKTVLAWLKQRVTNFLNAPNGSVVWGVKRLIEWIHETIVAVNAIRGNRTAQKQAEFLEQNYQNIDLTDM